MLHNKKVIIILISLLSCISLLSVGYASWTIVSNSAFGEASGNITADDVIYSTDYVSITENEQLLYCNYGFVDRNNKHNLTKVGNLKVAIDLNNLNQFKTKFGGDSLGVQIDLKYDNSNSAFALFDNTGLGFKVTVKDDSGTTIKSQDTTNLNMNTVLFDVPLTDKNSVRYYINYEWTNKDTNQNALLIDKNNWFYKSKLSSTLARKNLFGFSAKLESKGGNQ